MDVDERTRAHGSVAPGFEPVRDVFTAVLGEQRGTGARSRQAGRVTPMGFG